MTEATMPLTRADTTPETGVAPHAPGFALAAAMLKQPWIAPIPGTRRLERLAGNLGAAALPLTAEDVRQLDDASAPLEVAGERYPEHMQAVIDR